MLENAGLFESASGRIPFRMESACETSVRVKITRDWSGVSPDVVHVYTVKPRVGGDDRPVYGCRGWLFRVDYRIYRGNEQRLRTLSMMCAAIHNR